MISEGDRLRRNVELKARDLSPAKSLFAAVEEHVFRIAAHRGRLRASGQHVNEVCCCTDRQERARP